MPPSEKTPADDEQKIESTKEPLRARLAYGAEPVDVALSDITVGQSFYINGDESILLTELDMSPWGTDHRDAMVITITEPYHITDDGKLNLRGMILSVNPGEELRGTVSDNAYHGASNLGLTDAMEADARLPRTPKPLSLSIPITGVKLDQSLIARVKPSMMVKYKARLEQFNEYLKEKEIERLGELPGPVDSVATKKKSEKLATKAAAGKAKSLEDRADNQLLSSTKPPAKTRATKAEMIARSLDELLPDLKALNLPKGEYAVTYEGAMAARGLRKTYFTEVITSDSLWETLSKKHKVQEGYNGGHFIDIGPRVTVYGPGHPVRDGVPVEKQLAGAEMIGDIPFVSLGDLHTILLTGTSAKDPNDIKLIDAYQEKTAAKAKKTPGIVKAGTTDAPKVKGPLAGSTNVSGFFPNATAADGSPVSGTKVVSKIPKAAGHAAKPARIGAGFFGKLDDLKALNLPKGEYVVTNDTVMAAHGLRKTQYLDIITSDSLWETLSKEYGVSFNCGKQYIDIGSALVYGPGEHLHDAIPFEKQLANAKTIDGIPFVSLGDLHTIMLAGTTSRNQGDAELIEAYQAKTAVKTKKTPGVVKAGTTDAPKTKGLLAGSANVSGFFPNATATGGSPVPGAASTVPGAKVVSKIPKVKESKAEKIARSLDERLRDLKALNLPKGQYVVTNELAMAAHGLLKPDYIDVVASDSLWETLSKEYGVRSSSNGKQYIDIGSALVYGPGEHLHDAIPFEKQLAGAKMLGDIPFVSLGDLHTIMLAGDSSANQANVKLIEAYQAKTAVKTKKTPGVVKAGTTDAPKVKGLLDGSANVSGFFPNATATGGSPVPGAKVVSKIPKAAGHAAKPARIGAGFFGKLDDLKALNLPEGQYAVTSSGAMAAHGIREANDVDVVVSPYLWDALSRKHPVTRDGDFQKILIGDHTEILGPGSHFVDGRIAPMSAQLKGAELIGGVPFVNLHMVSAFKTAAGRAKDLADVGLIDAYRKRQMDGLKALAARIKAVRDTHREEFVPSTIAGYALGPIMGPAAVVPKTTHVPSTPATSTTVGLKNPAGTASFVFAPKSKQDLRRRKEKALPVVPRKDAPGTVKAGKIFASKNESRIASTTSVVEFFPGITTLEEMYKYVAAAKPSGAGDFKIDPDLEDAVKLHEKDLFHLEAVAKLFDEEEVAHVYANVQKYNLPKNISKGSIIHDMLHGVSSVSTEDSINFKKRRLASEIVREEETLDVLRKEYGRRVMALSEIVEDEKGLAVMRNTVAQIKADLRFEQRSLGSKGAGKRFSSGKKFLRNSAQGFLSSATVSDVPGSKSIASSVSPINTSTSERKYTSKGNKYVGAFAKDRVRKVRMGLVVSHGLIEANGEFAEANGQAGLLVSRPATKKELEGGILHHQLLTSGMYEMDSETMLESMILPTNNYAKTPGVKPAGLGEFKEMRYFISHGAASRIHEMNSGDLALMFRRYTSDNSRDQGDGAGALEAFLAKVNEFRENRALTESTIFGETNSVYNAGKEKEAERLRLAQLARRNRANTTAKPESEPGEKSMVGALARRNETKRQLASAKTFEDVLTLNRAAAENEHEELIAGLFAASDNTELIAVLEKKLETAVSVSEIASLNKRIAGLQAASTVKTLHSRFNTLVVNKRELKIGEAMSVGQMSDGNSSIARETNKGRIESSQKRAEEHYEVPTVTFDEMLARYKDPVMQIDGLSTAEFFQKHARNTPKGIFWNNSAMLVKDAASPGTITVSARLIPGSLHSGKMTVDSEFYKSLFKLPSNKYLPKDNTRLAPLYESISEVNRLRELTIEGSKGLPLSETALQTIQALDKREDRVRLEIRRIRNTFALTQDVQLSEDSIPLRKLQKALIQIPELKEMLLLGGTGSVKDDKFTVAYRAGKFDDYLKKLGTTNTKNLKGIKNINLEVADISKRYLGGARFDPIELLTQSQKTAFAMNDELAYQTNDKGYVDGINSHGELAPGISDLLEFMQKKPLQYNPANPREGVRDLVTNLFSSRTVPQSVQAGSLERTSQEGNQYSLAIDSGSNTQVDALNNMIGSGAEEGAEGLTPEFRSARDFFGKVSASTSEDIGYQHSASFETARDVLIGNYSDMPLDSEDKNAYLKRKGFFFGYKSGTVAGIQSAEPLTAREYNSKESVNTIVPSKETFKEISKLTPSQQKVMGSRIGIPFEQADFVPIDTTKGSPAGFQDLQTMLMSKELLPLDSRGVMVDPDSIPLSRAQQQIIEHVFRPALLDGLELDKDTQEHTAELEKYLKDPMTLRLPAMAEPSESDLRKAEAERESAFIRAEDLALKKRVMNATPEAINEAVGAFVRGTQRSYRIKHSTGSLNVEFTEDDASMVTVNGVNYSFDASTVIASGSAIDKELKSGVIAEGFSPKIKADEELAPIRQLVAGENRMIISPEMGSAGTHATLEKMLHKMNNGGATIIGFDIETEIEYARDKQGTILLDEDGEKKIDHSTVLHNVGSTTFTLTPDGVVDKTDGFDVKAAAFTKSKTAEPALGVGSIGRTVGKGHFGSEEEHMVSFVFDKFSAADKDAFFGVFNATFDVGRMTDYALDAINARLASIKEAEGKGMFNNSALKEQLDYFQKAHTFFKDEMPGRTIELSHLLEISGVQRTAPKKANSLEEFLVALKILLRGDQVHGGKQDIDDAILGVHKSVSEFTGGKALNLESFSFDGKTAGAQQYVFPMHLKYETENDRIKARFPKAPFVLDGLVETTITKPDGTLQQVVAMVGSKIDGNNERIGPSEIQGFHYRGSVIQQMATQDTRNDAYFITDLEHIDEGWKKTRSRENLRELIERNVRRATRYEGRGRGEADFGKRDQYEAKAAIAQEYEKKLGVSKVAAEAYITDVIKDLTETNESGPHYVKRPELQPLARASGDGKGTIDTSSAKKAFSFIRAEDAKIVKDWLLSGDTNKFGEAGFMMPHARATIIETAAVLKEREANHDAIFMDTFHEAGRTGIIAPEQIRSASAMYRSIMETSYSKAEQEIEGPATATIISTQQGRQKTTRLNGKMSQEKIYDALFDHSLTVTGRVQDVLDATEKDYSFDVPTAQEMANAKNPSTVKARKLIKERNAKLDPNVVKKMEADSEFTANELSEETQKVIEARNGKLNSMLVQGIQDDVRVSAPELSGIGIGSQHQSLRSLANEIHQLLSSSSRKVKVANDLYSGPLFTASGEEANYEHMATTFGAAIDMDLPKTSEGMREWSKNQKNMQELYYAMEKTMGQGAYRTTDYDSKMPEMYTPEDTSLKNALKSIEKPTVTRFARKIEYSESGKAELIANTMNEQYAESILENEKRAIQKAENKLSPMKIGGGIGALALAAFAVETISDMGDAAKDRENDSVVGQPRSTTAHNAGPLDTELNQKGSDSNTAANQGWSRLHIDIELEHPGYAGSDKRLDTEALKAFSDDVGSTLSRHFDAAPTYTSSQSSNQDNSLRYRVGDMLNRSSGRYR